MTDLPEADRPTRRLPRLLAWSAVLALLVPWRGNSPTPTGAGVAPPLLERLLGPASSLVASAYWVRFDLALRDGEPDRAYALAERALRWAPRAASGWHTLGRHLIFDRASLESEPDPARRRAWIRAGLEVLERGESRAADPGQLAYLRGTILCQFVAEIAGDLDWPGGRAGALDAGRRALERAERLGFRRGGGAVRKGESPPHGAHPGTDSH